MLNLIKISIFLLFFNFILCQSDKEVDYYLNLMNEANADAEKFEFPTNANEYLPDNDKLTSFGLFDFIIVGGGTTGAVVARRLSDNGNITVLVLEAGEFGNNLTSIPGLGLQEQLNTKYNWGYKSIPQKTSCLGVNNRQCVYPRCKGIGGSSLMNGLINARGGSTDYNKWYRMGNPGWSYQDVLPLFKKVENFEKSLEAPAEPEYHGIEGPINVDYSKPQNPKTKFFLDGHRELGWEILDYNGKYLTGASPLQVATKHGRRVDSGTAYLKPVMNRSNLKILTHSYVSKITFAKNNPTTASGVIFSHNKQLFSATAKKEIILSAGVIGSPQLLMLSGIGPKSHLRSLNISLVNHLEVGSTFREHPMFFGLSITTNLTNSQTTAKDQVKQFLNGEGPLTVPGNNFAISFFPPGFRDRFGNYAEIELLMQGAKFKQGRKIIQKALQWTDDTYDSLWGENFEDALGLEILVILLHEKSSGTLRLKSNNAYDYPLIDPNMLSDRHNRDIQAMYNGIQMVQRLLNTETFQKINASLQFKPHPACKQYKLFSRSYWFCALRQETQTVYHPVGTCPMGPWPRKGAVVNYQLKVHGINNLRVADASIFPTTISGHPYFPCVMIGELVSNSIKKEL